MGHWAPVLETHNKSHCTCGAKRHSLPPDTSLTAVHCLIGVGGHFLALGATWSFNTTSFW